MAHKFLNHHLNILISDHHLCKLLTDINNVQSMYYLANIIVLDDCVAHSECFVLAPSYHH